MKPRVILALLTLTLTVACKETVDLNIDTRQMVRVTPVQHGQLSRKMSFSASLQPVERARLAFQSAGVVKTRPVKLGSVVRAGELLATLENPELEPAQQAAIAALQETMTRRDQARRDLDRLETLAATGAVGAESLEQKRSQLHALEAGLARAEANVTATRQRLDDASLVAPFDGIISAVNVEPGEFVAYGQPVVDIGGAGNLEMEVMLPASVAGYVVVGASTDVQLPQLGDVTIPGVVTEMSTVGNPLTGLFPAVVQVQTAATSLRAGMLAKAWFKHAENEGFIVPLAAIVDPVGGDPRVYRVERERITTVPVNIIAASDAQVAVAPRGAVSMADGDLVVTEGHRALTDGQPVRTVL